MQLFDFDVDELIDSFYRFDQDIEAENNDSTWPGKQVSQATQDTLRESFTPDPESSPSATVSPDPSPHPESEAGFKAVLKNPNFLALWSAQVFSQLADKVYLVLMIALIASRFQENHQTISGWVSAIMIAFTIPAVLFGSLAGVFVDRWSKKTTLVLTNVFRGVIVLALPLLLWASQDINSLFGLPLGFLLLLVSTFLVSTLTQYFAPAEQAVLPLIVKKQQLLSANSLYTMTMMASVIVGFAVGEPVLVLADTLMSRVSGSIGFGKELLVGGCYCLAGVLLLLVETGEKTATAEQEHPHPWQDIQEGLRYLSNHHKVRNALLQLVILFSIFAALAVLAVRLAEVIPTLKAEQFGFLLAAGGIGIAIGATIVGHYGQRIGTNAQLSLIGSMGMAGSLVGLSLVTHHLLACLLLIGLLGGFAALVGVPMQTTIQENTPEAMRGKVFGLQNNAVNIALSLPLALAGVAEAYFGLQVVFAGLAAIAIAGGVSTWYITRQTATTFSEQASTPSDKT